MGVSLRPDRIVTTHKLPDKDTIICRSPARLPLYVRRLGLTVALRNDEAALQAAERVRGVWNDLQGHMRVARQVQQMLQLFPHHLGTTNGTVQNTLVDDRDNHRGLVAREDGFALHPRRHPFLHLLRCDPRLGPQYRAGVSLGFEQSWDERRLVAAKRGGVLFLKQP